MMGKILKMSVIVLLLVGFLFMVGCTEDDLLLLYGEPDSVTQAMDLENGDILDLWYYIDQDVYYVMFEGKLRGIYVYVEDDLESTVNKLRKIKRY